MLAKLINALYAGMPDSVQVLADYLREQGVEEAAVNDLINSLLFGPKTPPHRERRRALTVPLVEVVRRGAFGYPLLVEFDDRDDLMVHVRHYARDTDGPRIRIAFHGWCSEGIR